MRKLLLVVIIALLPCQSFAAAFLVYQQDAKAQGMGMAVTASLDNPAAIFYNPALLTDQKGFGFSVNDAIVMPERKFKDSLTGITYNAKATTHNLPTLFAKYTRDDLSIGLGIFSPFGLSSEWPSYWPGRYNSIYAELKTVYINPVVAFRMNEYVSLGFGLSYIKSSITMKNALPLAPAPDGLAKLSGDADAVSYNAGVTVKLPEQYTVAMTFRSGANLDVDGTAKFYVIPQLKPLFPNFDASATLSMPWLATLGIAKKLGPWTFEADLIYSGWSSFDRYTIDFAGIPVQSFYKDWTNTPSIALGVNYIWNKNLEMQAGYMYDRTPVPKKTLTPEIPDASRNLFTVGASYKKDGFKASAAYQATFFDQADSRNNIVNAPRGKYDSFINVIVVGVAYEW